ncbi:MAG: DUF1189 family protein [Bacillota bacterium]
MLDRVKTAIVSPGSLIKYRNDRLYKVFLYMIFFGVLMTTSTIIMLLSFNGIDGQTKRAIEENYKAPESACVIEDSTLSCDESSQHVAYEGQGAQFVIDSTESLNTGDYGGFSYTFVLHEDSVHAIVMGVSVQEMAISSLHPDLHNLNLNPNAEEEDAFFQAIYNTVDETIEETKPLWGTTMIITNFLSALLLFNMFVLINTFFIQRRLQKVPFRQMYTMMTYASTLLFVVLVFDSMWQLNLFVFIILLLVAFRQTSKLTFEIQRRLYKR